MTALYDNDPSIIASAPSQIEDETGSSEYIEGLKEFAKQQLRSKIVETQSSGKISAATPAKVIEEPEAAPVKGAGGTQTFNKYLDKDTLKMKKDADLNYQQSANIDFDSGDKALRALNADVVFTEDGAIESRNTNTVLPKDGGFVMYGIPLTDFSKEKQEALKKAGITGTTVDVLRITETTEKVDDGYGNVSGGGEKSTLIPITPQVRTSLKGASDKFRGLEQTSAGELD